MALLVNLIVLLVVLGLLYWLVSLLPLAEPFPTIIRVVFIILAIVVVLQSFFGGGISLPTFR